MFDIGFTELVLLGIIGLIVIGPQKLPHTIRMIAAYTGRIKRTVNDLKHELEQEVDAQEIRQRIQQEMEQSGLPQLKQDIHNSAQDLQQSVQDIAHEPASTVLNQTAANPDAVNVTEELTPLSSTPSTPNND
ncbi:MAG: Sec-independent protein translocase protein TatB [Gammaproteobacteria bacterium]|nr:Sec-independent protein translocase protein TatB [Gammaproteobacteria bacterium]